MAPHQRPAARGQRCARRIARVAACGASAHARRAASIAAGLAFAWFAPSAEAVAWIAARFDGMALLWMLVAACAFMASRQWRDRYSFVSLAATLAAFLSKESAAIGPVLIVALGWVKRSGEQHVLRRGVRTLAARFRGSRWRALISRTGHRSSATPSGSIRGPRRDLPSCPGSGSPRCPLAATGGRSHCPKPARATYSPSPACCSASLHFPRDGATGRRRTCSSPSVSRSSRRSRCCFRTGAGRQRAKAGASSMRRPRSSRWRWRCRCVRPTADCGAPRGSSPLSFWGAACC